MHVVLVAARINHNLSFLSYALVTQTTNRAQEDPPTTTFGLHALFWLNQVPIALQIISIG